MDMGAQIIQADKKARDGMWLVLSISTDSLTIRILLADTYDITEICQIVPKICLFNVRTAFSLYVVYILLYNKHGLL